MAPELSSNWKKLQPKIKAESTATSGPKSTAKRKAEADTTTAPPLSKRQKLQGTSKLNSPKGSHHSKSKPTPTQMGVTQSSAVTKGTAATITPSLALWAEDNDISAEDLAEAYALGARGNASQSLARAERPRVNEGLAHGVEAGKYVAVDCEMVGVGDDGRDSVLVRVSAVDYHGRQVYDSFVWPREQPVTDWRTPITGLTERRMEEADPRAFEDVQADVAALLQGRILVGHDVRHDLAALLLDHPPAQIRDTARFSGYRTYGHGPKPALKVLAREVLGVDIQTGHHSSIEDARVAMLLFRKKKSEFDVVHATRYGEPASETAARTGKGTAKTKARDKKKKKKKRR
ncbi:ribonuclease H-like domain-containing protein [Xylariaceae sp. FL0662B]|nr:ribonuclease H-like domain-containing protein [Xylariaceae sp. FL0662B]